MKLISVFWKSLIEQIREYWILLFTLSTAPFFVFLYYLMVVSETPVYVLAINNQDTGVLVEDENMKYSIPFMKILETIDEETSSFKFYLKNVTSREDGIMLLKNKKADLCMVISEEFSRSIRDHGDSTKHTKSHIEFIGDLTSYDYMISAIFTSEYFNQYLNAALGFEPPYTFTETSLGLSGEKSEFDIYVPGLIIFSIIVMILSAAAAIVKESEVQTLKRLKISRLSAFEFLAGTSLVQIIVAFLSLFFTLIVAIALGFKIPENTFLPILIICFVLSISIISLGLILAAFCRSVKDVMIIGVFPFFLLMFFTGATFPMNSSKIFTIGDYSLTIHGLLSPSQAVDALNKILNLGVSFTQVMPQIIVMIVLTIVYFLLGLWAFNERHLKAS